jgi:hypothetical protein
LARIARGSKFKTINFDPSSPWVGIFGTQNTDLTSFGLINYDSLCNAFNVTEEEIIVQRIRKMIPLDDPESTPIPVMYWIIGGCVLLIIGLTTLISCFLMRKHKQLEILE